MKTKEELNALREEVEVMNKKLAELTEEELKEVVGGFDVEFDINDQCGEKEFHFYDNNVEKEFQPKFPTDSDK